jgi:glyoxylase-like metal-dependent hydrolase (beta-lactamase superfamily II)
MHQIKQGIYYEDIYLGVTLGALVFPNGTILIDAPLRPEDARSWRSTLMSLRGGTNRMMISLDSHLDRTLGARSMECTIISHQKTAQVYRNRPLIFKGQTIESGADWETYNDVIGTRWASPDITFTDQMTLHWGGPVVVLEHHPGPTPGAIWVIIPEDKIVFIGDAVVPNQPPFLDNAELDTWLPTLDLLYSSYKDYIIISGRGGLVTREDVRTQVNHLKKISKQIERLAAKNASPEMTEDLIPKLLNDLAFPLEFTERYAQRLRAGLYQFYNRQFHPLSALESNDLEVNLE